MPSQSSRGPAPATRPVSCRDRIGADTLSRVVMKEPASTQIERLPVEVPYGLEVSDRVVAESSSARARPREGSRETCFGWATGSPAPGRTPTCCRKGRHVEGVPILEHVVDGACRSCARRWGAPWPCRASSPAASHALASAASREQDGRFGEGPLQMGVADLVAAEALASCRPTRGAAHQPGVGEELADLGEAADVVDLVEQDQARILPMPGTERSSW